jgi:hypothetical protein
MLLVQLFPSLVQCVYIYLFVCLSLFCGVCMMVMCCGVYLDGLPTDSSGHVRGHRLGIDIRRLRLDI